MKMKAYITCPVSHSQDRLHILPIMERAANESGLDTFVFKIGGTPEEIFERDYNQLKDCGVIIAEVSDLSHGVGIEIGMSYCLGLKRIFCIEKGKHLTKLALGMPDSVLVEYADIDDLRIKLQNSLSGI